MEKQLLQREIDNLKEDNANMYKAFTGETNAKLDRHKAYTDNFVPLANNSRADAPDSSSRANNTDPLSASRQSLHIWF